TKKDQVVLLDWSSAADDLSIFNAAGWVPAVAKFAKDTLSRWGIAGSQVNIAAHSLGGLLADRLAHDFSGGVNRIVALDPATDLAGIFISGVDYADRSKFSIGFIASSHATPEAAATADLTFKASVGQFDSFDAHSNVVDLFASMLRANNG